MVTEIVEDRTQVETKPVIGVREAGALIGIPVVIRPWWGSRRQLYVRIHRKCGHEVRLWGEWFCMGCDCRVAPNMIKIVKLEKGRWVCPGPGQQLKWPEVENDTVVMWAGPCRVEYLKPGRKRYGGKYHRHRQELEVVDYTDTAMLVRVSVAKHRLSFLISRDEGRPFVQVVTKNQATVAEAYDFLVPVPVFQAQMHGFDVKRQGDWFFVPREFWTERPVRAIESRIRPWPGVQDSVPGSADYGTAYSNAPLDRGRTRHIAELYILTWPHELVKGTITAPDHAAVHLDTWHCAVRVRQTPAFNPSGADDD